MPNNIDFSAPDFREYYNLDNDPWELTNLYNDNVNVAPLEAELKRWFNCAGDDCP